MGHDSCKLHRLWLQLRDMDTTLIAVKYGKDPYKIEKFVLISLDFAGVAY